MREWFHFLQEQPSALSYSVFFWLRCLLWLAGFFAIFSCVLNAMKKRNIGVFWNAKRRIIANANSILTNVTILILGIIIGYASRDHQLVSNTRTYFGVSVLAQLNDRKYTVKVPGYQRTYDWEFCDPLAMPSQLIDIRYEQHYGCKLVNGIGFVSPHEENQNELQNGRHSATTPTAAIARLEERQP